MSFGCLRANTNSITHLKQHGFEVVEMWECDINKCMISSVSLKFDKYLPLRLHQALYGGKTSPIWLKKTCISNANIHYVDFTSLYPSVQKGFSFPIGHPSILVGNECDEVNFNWFCRLMKCDILPPKNLYFPVLPCKFNGKLIFTLCRSCVFNTQEQYKVNIDCQY